MLKVMQHIYIVPILFGALFSTKAFTQGWPLFYRIFSGLLMGVFAIELVSILWKYVFFSIPGWPFSRSNIWLYNAFLAPQYLLYLTAYFFLLKSTAIRRIIIMLGVAYTILVILNWLLFQDIHTVNSISLIAASAIIIFLTVSYFEQLRKDENTGALFAYPAAWISLGAFIFHAANIPYIFCLNFLSLKHPTLAVSLFYVYLILNCLMYSLYTTAFLWKRPLLK
jgi:hypothetical protein